MPELIVAGLNLQPLLDRLGVFGGERKFTGPVGFVPAVVPVALVAGGELLTVTVKQRAPFLIDSGGTPGQTVAFGEATAPLAGAAVVSTPLTGGALVAGAYDITFLFSATEANRWQVGVTGGGSTSLSGLPLNIVNLAANTPFQWGPFRILFTKGPTVLQLINVNAGGAGSKYNAMALQEGPFPTTP